MIYDISPVITSALAVFPGDQAFQRHVSRDLGRGDGYTLSSMTTTMHLGAHVDAPNHYHAAGDGIEQRALDYYLGACQVIDVRAHCQAKARRLSLRCLSDQRISCSRILFRTGTFPDPNRWCDDFMGLSAELVDALAEKHVKLIGIDTPSIDPASDEQLLAHQRVFHHDQAILEGIVLDKVPAGRYILSALPLPIQGADASPVRAVLLTEQAWQTIT